AYIAMFIYPFTWSFYTASVLVGIGAAAGLETSWPQTPARERTENIGRNSGIFWALLQFSLFFGNLYIYCAWRGHDHITDKDRKTVFISLTVISLVGCFLFFLIRKPDSEPSSSSDVTESLLQPESSDDSASYRSVLQTFTQSLMSCKLFVTKEMLLLLSTCIAYTGLELTFYSGVYGTSVGAMKRLGTDAKGLIGLSGICIGAGEILGGGVFGMLNKCTRFGRNPVVLLGLITHYVAFYLIFLNIADDAPVAPEGGTDLQAFITHPGQTANVGVVFLCSSWVSGQLFNTQAPASSSFMFKDHSAPAFAVFNLSSFPHPCLTLVCLTTSAVHSSSCFLIWQLVILVVSGFLGTVTFFGAEWVAESSRRNSDYDSI
ncbi:hypothetical protein NL108_018595, partial [Boleophthalmus pectinirostris]